MAQWSKFTLIRSSLSLLYKLIAYQSLYTSTRLENESNEKPWEDLRRLIGDWLIDGPINWLFRCFEFTYTSLAQTIVLMYIQSKNIFRVDRTFLLNRNVSFSVYNCSAPFSACYRPASTFNPSWPCFKAISFSRRGVIRKFCSSQVSASSRVPLRLFLWSLSGKGVCCRLCY